MAMGLNLGDLGGIRSGVCCAGWVIIWALGWMEWGHAVGQVFGWGTYGGAVP